MRKDEKKGVIHEDGQSPSKAGRAKRHGLSNSKSAGAIKKVESSPSKEKSG